MSLFSNIGKAISKAARDVTREVARSPVTSLLPGGGIIRTVANLAAPPRAAAPALSMPSQVPTFQPGTLPVQPFTPSVPGGGAALLPAVAGPIGGVIGGVVGGAINTFAGGILNRLTPGSTAASGCGCGHSNGRDPCTRQKMTSQPAPTATFFGGCCPPGRTLRRINNGRDICIKTPRMNPFNPRALARADARITTFARRAAPIFRDMGFAVSSTRKVTLKKGRKRGRR